MRSCAILRCDRGTGLSQAVRSAIRWPGLIAPIAEFVADAGIRKCAAKVVNQERQFATRGDVDYALQGWQNRQLQSLRFAVATFPLREYELAALHVLLAESNDITAALPGEHQERKRKSGFGADRMPLLELLHILDRPGVEAGRSSLKILHVAGRVA